MREWLVIQQLSQDASRGQVLLELLSARLVSLSALALLACITLAVAAVGMIPVVTDGWWTPAVMAPAILVIGLVGGLVLEDRASVVFQSRPAALHLNGLVRRYRRGFLGPRYILFAEELRETDYFTVDALESALRCCDAEIAMRRHGRPAGRTAPAVLATLIAVGLTGMAPHVGQYGLGQPVLILGLLTALVAMVLIAFRSAQPAPAAPEETRCLLVWALEEARGEPRGRRMQ